jgi:cyclopropane fatty-acyl-phospholipid synthase-like methyltransferase
MMLKAVARWLRGIVVMAVQARGLTNVKVITCDINVFEAEEAGAFDRVISIEMFEHMKNYQKLMAKVHGQPPPESCCNGSCLDFHVE